MRTLIEVLPDGVAVYETALGVAYVDGSTLLWEERSPTLPLPFQPCYPAPNSVGERFGQECDHLL